MFSTSVSKHVACPKTAAETPGFGMGLQSRDTGTWMCTGLELNHLHCPLRAVSDS